MREEPGGDRSHVGVGTILDESELLGVPPVDHEGVKVIHNGLLLCGSQVVRARVAANDRIGGDSREVRPPRSVELSRNLVSYAHSNLVKQRGRVR